MNDLESLLTWDTETREQVRDALLPLCSISDQGKVVWKSHTNDKRQLQARWDLAEGVLFELGLGGRQLSAERALELAEQA